MNDNVALNQELLFDFDDEDIKDLSSTKSALPVEVVGDNNTNLLLYEKDFLLDPNVIHGALFNWTEHIVYEKTVNFRHRTVSIIGASKSKEQLKEEFSKLKKNKKPDKNKPEITSIRQLGKQLPISGDVEARLYFAILKLFYQRNLHGSIQRKLITTYQEIKSVMGLSPTFPTSDLKDSLFKLAHTRYDFKDCYIINSTDSATTIKQSHSLYLLNYYELEIANIKERVENGDSIEDFPMIEEILKTFINKRGKPTATLLKITLDEEQWKNLSMGYNLLYSYEHLKSIPRSVARGLYLFLDPNQGILFTNGRIIKTDQSNIFTVKAQYIIEYLGSSDINPSKSLSRINKALDLLRNEGYIKKYGFVTNTRRVLDGVYDIEFFPEQSRSTDNKYGAFMVKSNPKALVVPVSLKSQIDLDYEQLLSSIYTLVGGEKLLTTGNKSGLRAIYYDDNNIIPAQYMGEQLDKTYGFYYLSGILYGITLVKAKDLNGLIRGIILAESNPSSKKSGYKNHSIAFMKRDFIKKYGKDKLEELSEKINCEAIQNFELQPTISQLHSNNLQHVESSWDSLIGLYVEVFGISSKNERMSEFSSISRDKLLQYFSDNNFLAIKLANYVINKAKDVNAYLSKHDIKTNAYVTYEDANTLQITYNKNKEIAKEKENKKATDKNKLLEIQTNKQIIESDFYKLADVEQETYTKHALWIFEKASTKFEKFDNINNILKFCIYAKSNGKSYDYALELFITNSLHLKLEIF